MSGSKTLIISSKMPRKMDGTIILMTHKKRINKILTSMGRSEKTVKQLVIPFSLDKRKRRIGYWTQHVCFESDVEETMDDWSNWGWSEKHIEFYQRKKVIL